MKDACRDGRRSRFKPRPSSQLALIFLVAIAFNYPWELAQAPLYVGMDDFSAALSHCFLSSVGDGFLVLAIVVTGWFVLGESDWFAHPGAGGYLLMLAVGGFIAVSVEWAAVHVAERWSYTDRMPRVPGLDVGVLPIAQMLLLPPLIFRTVRPILERRPTSYR